MNKYKVMLVDDEEDVAQAIMKKMNWEEMGFEKPRYAHNGLEALELAEESRPDIVMTDIKMPYMDGMELSRNLRKLYPNIRIIIFSGFDEFEYAKEAIRLEAEEYILKPIDADELKACRLNLLLQFLHLLISPCDSAGNLMQGGNHSGHAGNLTDLR